jgi:hypothetical protein
MEYTNKAKFIADLENKKIPGVILWRGASAIDGTPIVLVANRFDAKSGNEKTGAMVQTWILPDPHAAGIECTGSRPAKIMSWLKETAAQSICGDCPHAWQYNAATGQNEKGTCYVREYQAPAATLGGVYRGAYPIAGIDFPTAWIADIGAGRDIRAGSYGDPAACAPEIWAAFMEKCAGRTVGKVHFRHLNGMHGVCAACLWRHVIARLIYAPPVTPDIAVFMLSRTAQSIRAQI